jgi:anti-sigma regulatory factor (Ser/Thr protein kinase)
MSSPGSSLGRWELAVPPDARFASTLRSFIAAVGRALTLDAERVEDLKLILTEVCDASAEARGTERLTVAVHAGTGERSASVRCVGAGPPPAGGAGEFRSRLLRSLADDLDWSGDGTVDFSI